MVVFMLDLQNAVTAQAKTTRYGDFALDIPLLEELRSSKVHQKTPLLHKNPSH